MSKQNKWTFDTVFGLLIIFIFAVVIIIFSGIFSIITFIIAAWMVSNARDRGYKLDDQIGVAALGIILSVIGLIIWFLIRKEKRRNK